MTLLRRDLLHRFDDETQVRRCRSTTATDDVRAEVICEMDDLRGETFRRLVVMHLAVDDGRQAGVWKHRYGQRRVLADVANALRHVLWTSAAVHSDHVDRKRRERCQGSGDLGAVEHRPKHFDRDLCDYGHASTRLFEVTEDRGECGFCLQEILTRLDDQQIDAAVEQS